MLPGEPATVAHRHGHAGEDKSREEEDEEQSRRFQMQKEETGKNIAAGRQSQISQDPKHRASLHGKRPARAGGPAETESYEPCKQWVPVTATPGPGLLRKHELSRGLYKLRTDCC